jgi:putrescine aminotransferase
MTTDPSTTRNKSMTSAEILLAYQQRSWRYLAELQHAAGLQFVVGAADGSYLWNLEGTQRILDCGNAGGVHALGHRNPELLATLREAYEHHDAGIWWMPTREALEFQDALVAMAPSPDLCRCITTLSSTDSIDLALMFAMRCTGRSQLVAYRRGYHGHGGLAAHVTGSDSDGQIDHYSLSRAQTRFFEDYNSVDSVAQVLDQNCAALILELMNYETFQPASSDFLASVAAECRAKGVMLIIDETRTGLGRSGRPWMTSHYASLSPDLIVLGKGLGGGLYPVSALLTTQPIYDRCMNDGHWGYSSSMAGSPVASLIAHKVIQIIQRPALAANVKLLESTLEHELTALVNEFSDVFMPGTVLGAIATLGLRDASTRSSFLDSLFQRGVMAHSVSAIAPCVVKFLPCLTSDATVVEQLVAALRTCALDLRER